MTQLAVLPNGLVSLRPGDGDCWNRIGVRGDRSCPELPAVGHCQNCPVFAAAGRRFLDAPAPDGYADEWADRLAPPVEETAANLESVLVFRVADEWLALSVHVLVEVTSPKPVHRVPHRAGVLAGLVNVRGELYLCVHLAKVLGIEASDASIRAAMPPTNDRDRRRRGGVFPGSGGAGRMLLVRRDADRWVFPVDAVDQVHRVARTGISKPPATVGRAASQLTHGVFSHDGRAVGLIDDSRLFETLRTKLR